MHEAMKLSRKNAADVIRAGDKIVVFLNLGEIYFSKSQMNLFLRESLYLRCNFFASLQDFTEAPRNIPRWKFVYTDAAPYRAAQARFRKNPAVAAAGS
jgi:hypothetical protein